MEWLLSGFFAKNGFDDFLTYPFLAMLAIMGYVGGKLLRAHRMKNHKAECFPSSEGKLEMQRQCCSAPEVIHRIRKARGRSASLRRECVALVGLTRYFLEYACSRTLGLYTRPGSAADSGQTCYDSIGKPEKKELAEVEEHSSRKRLQATKQTQEPSAVSRKGKRTKKPQTTKPAFETMRFAQADSLENSVHVGGHSQNISRSVEAYIDQEVSDLRKCHGTFAGNLRGDAHPDQQDANDLAECRTDIADADCKTPRDSCKSVGMPSVSVESSTADETLLAHRSNDNESQKGAPASDSTSDILCQLNEDHGHGSIDESREEVVIDSTPDMVHPPDDDHGLGSTEEFREEVVTTPDIFHPRDEANGLGSIDESREEAVVDSTSNILHTPKGVHGLGFIEESREEVMIVPVPELRRGQRPTVFEWQRQNSITTFQSSSSTLLDSDEHVENTCIYSEEPSFASTVSLYGGVSNSHSSHSASWHTGEGLMSDFCSCMAPYGMNCLREEPLGQHVNAASLADWTHHDYPNDVFSLVDPVYEDWQVDLSHQELIHDVVDDYYFGVNYWGAYCGDDHAETFGYHADVFQELEMKPVEQPLRQAASWVDDNEKKAPPPDIVLGDRENEYMNLQLIAEMGDWCVLKEVVGEQAGVPFYWNRSTGQRTWRMPQIMEETGLADALKSYAQRLPPPDHDAPFRQRQVRAIRLTRGQNEKHDRLRSRRRTSQHIESLAHWPDDAESSTIVPDFLLTDEAFPTLKKSFEASQAINDEKLEPLA